jgi:hypothetical protein
MMTLYQCQRTATRGKVGEWRHFAMSANGDMGEVGGWLSEKKDSKLARTAMRYKINIPQVAAQVRSELSRKDKPGKNAPKPSASPLRK